MTGRGLPVHPILALQMVNRHTKTIDARLQTARPAHETRALRQERTYLYELKHRASSVLLTLGWLRPFGANGGLLYVEGAAPYGTQQFHLPAQRFPAHVDRAATGRDTPLPVDATRGRWASPRTVEEGVAALTRIIARGNVG